MVSLAELGDLVGKRVRVCLHPLRACAEMAHSPVEDGQTGTVVRVEGHILDPAHPVLVAFDAPLSWPVEGGASVPLPRRYYEPDELELLSPPSGARSAAAGPACGEDNKKRPGDHDSPGRRSAGERGADLDLTTTRRGRSVVPRRRRAAGLDVRSLRRSQVKFMCVGSRSRHAARSARHPAQSLSLSSVEPSSPRNRNVWTRRPSMRT